jgi:hypothetical protein
MFTRYDFMQAQLLKNVTDPEVRNGVCAALCDFWLRTIKIGNASPDQRLRELAGRFSEVIAHQKQYQRERAKVGPVAARQRVGQPLGLDYEQQTSIMPACIGLQGVRERLATDLRRLGAATTWSLRFIDGGGHVMAGFSGLTSITTNMHRQQVSIFDPNIGEYVGEITDMDDVFRDIFRLIPAYARINEVRRVTVGDLKP